MSKEQKEQTVTHEFADPKQLERRTEPFLVRIGIEPADTGRYVEMEAFSGIEPMGVEPRAEAMAVPRTDLNGLRVKLPNRPEIYLVDRGYRRWIPNPFTYNNLFRDWNGIVVDINITDISLGASFTSGAVLVRPDGSAPVYLVDNGVKRWITSPAAMDKYHFNWGRVYVIPPVVVNSIPTADPIT
jgi:hypothetical protein